MFGRYPEIPWIPYPVTRAIERLADPHWRVLEHGAGYSTLWWARRAASVHAIEANTGWYEHIQAKLDLRGANHVHLELRTGPEYADFSMFEDGSFDFMSIDGHAREAAAAAAPRLLKRPGWIYFDDSDFAEHWHEMYGEAEEILRELAARENAHAEYITGFVGATMVAGQGLLLTLPARE